MTSYKACIKALSDAFLQKGIHYNLDNVLSNCKKLGNPQEKLPPCIHIAGTNGKGSTLAFIKAGLINAGFNVGSFTSPHLLSYTERIQINNDPISEKDFVHYFNKVRQICPSNTMTEFECLTLMSFSYFQNKKPDFILYETGLGGRLDSTNVISPLLSIITSIGMDHMSILGNTLEKIAGEKSGIIKANTPCISATQEKPVEIILTSKAQQVDAPISFISPKEIPQNSQLQGQFQEYNFALAEAASSYLNLSLEHVSAYKKGLIHAKHPGRYMKYNIGNGTVIFDGAHNDDAIQALKNSLLSDFPKEKFPIICGILKTKDALKILSNISDICETLYYPTDLDDSFFNYSEIQNMYTGNLKTITCGALPQKKEKKPTIITGSLYFISRQLKSFKLAL